MNPLRERRPVRLGKGESVVVDAGLHAQIVVERERSGAVTVRNRETWRVLRQWSPKEAKRG